MLGLAGYGDWDPVAFVEFVEAGFGGVVYAGGPGFQAIEGGAVGAQKHLLQDRSLAVRGEADEIGGGRLAGELVGGAMRVAGEFVLPGVVRGGQQFVEVAVDQRIFSAGRVGGRDHGIGEEGNGVVLMRVENARESERGICGDWGRAEG